MRFDGNSRFEARNAFWVVNRLHRAASGGIAPRNPPFSLKLLRHAPTTTTRSNYYDALQLLRHDPTINAASQPKRPPRNPATTRFPKDSHKNPPHNAPKSHRYAPIPYQILLEVILGHPNKRKNNLAKIKIFHENRVQKSPPGSPNGLRTPNCRGHTVIG